LTIKNRAELAAAPMRAAVLDIIEAGIESVLPRRVIPAAVGWDAARRVLRVGRAGYSVSRAGRIFVIGGGKANGAMAVALEKVLGEDITDGVATCNAPPSRYRTRRIRLVEAGHPVPDERGAQGVRLMLDLKAMHSIGRDDLVICLISGGGSALMPCPVPGVTLEEKQELTQLLLRSGADIGEINTVRKHLSLVKGGRLGAFFAPATVVSLVISDVVGNDLSVIASGPTQPDATTFEEARCVLRKYGLLSVAPRAVTRYLDRGVRGLEPDTPKTLKNCHNHIIADNRLALKAMAQKARQLGMNPHVITAEQTGDTAAVAVQRASQVISGKYAGHDLLLIGGETTPTLPPDHGEGGRNQHYAATSMLAMRDYPGEWVVASVGTDGSDYLSSVAGAIVGRDTVDAARKKRLNVQGFLVRYDGYSLLKKAGGSLIKTGHTDTNVGDLAVYALRPGGA